MPFVFEAVKVAAFGLAKWYLRRLSSPEVLHGILFDLVDEVVKSQKNPLGEEWADKAREALRPPPPPPA